MINTAEIQRILRGIGWPIKFHDFDPPYNFQDRDISQLIAGTSDGFPTMESQIHCDTGPDPPSKESYSDPPWWNDCRDPPHCEDGIDPPHWTD